MPNIAKHPASSVTKMLLIGDSGAGKTGAIASLAAAGYNVRLLDIDAGADILANLLTDPHSPYPNDAAKNLYYETITDTYKSTGGKVVRVHPTVWNRAMSLLDSWKTESENFGPIQAWTPRDVLVIDSLSALGNAAMDSVCAMNGRLGEKPYQSDYGDAQRMLEGFCQRLADEHVNTNVVVITHLKETEDDVGVKRRLPNTVGKAFSSVIGRYFNSVALAMTKNRGKGNEVHVIVTKSTGGVELKSSAPLRVKAEYGITMGLAEYFRDEQGRAGLEPTSVAEPAPASPQPA
jgi:hypothetical protein